ncbi:MAG TPA: hypothetical protein VLA92_04365 [Candidatus Saccharimonadales bacterium]|nr:hypothetical protein [Candidatus Saccharimonadales bacterium]
MSERLLTYEPWPYDANQVESYKGEIALDVEAHNAPREGWDIISTPSTICGIPMYGGRQEEGSFEYKAAYIQAMLEDNPQTAEAILSNRIAGFHGTSSAALYSILCEGGLVTAQRAQQENIPLSTGERLVSERTGQDTISFADWRATDTLAHYSQVNAQPLTKETSFDRILDLEDQHRKRARFLEMLDISVEEDDAACNLQQQIKDAKRDYDYLLQDPDGLEADLMRLNFPMLVGVNVDGLRQNVSQWSLKQLRQTEAVVMDASSLSAYGEFQVHTSDGKLGFERLPVVAVPWEYTGYAQQLFDDFNTNTTVVPLEAILPSNN